MVHCFAAVGGLYTLKEKIKYPVVHVYPMSNRVLYFFLECIYILYTCIFFVTFRYQQTAGLPSWQFVAIFAVRFQRDASLCAGAWVRLEHVCVIFRLSYVTSLFLSFAFLTFPHLIIFTELKEHVQMRCSSQRVAFLV